MRPPAALLRRPQTERPDLVVNLGCSAGHYVAIIGDGVNDVLPLKQANLVVTI